jgi:DNA-binding GntR family transcriptional regulator
VRARLPNGIGELLKNRIDSFDKLELVVALHGAPRATMSVEDLCRRLKLPREVVRSAVVELRAVSLVALTSQGEVQLLPPTDHDREIVATLVTLYSEDRVEVVRTLGQIAVERIRGMASRAFADAFVIRRKPPKDGDDG